MEPQKMIGREIPFRARDGVIRTGQIKSFFWNDVDKFQLNVIVTKGPDIGHGFSVGPDDVDNILGWLSEV